MITIKRKISFILAFVLVLSCFYNPNKIVYAAAPDVQVKITLNHFDAKDELKTVNKTIQLGGNAQIKDAHISTPIQIDFQDKNNNNPINIKTTNTSDTLKDFIILTKDGNTTNLVPSVFNVSSFANTAFISIKLSPLTNKSLDPDANYTLKIDTSKLSTFTGSTPLGNQNFVFKISSERTPKITSIKSENNKLKITFDRKIDKDIANNAIIDNNNIFLKDENAGVGATFKKLSDFGAQNRKIEYEPNTTTSTVLVGPIKNGKYTVLVNNTDNSISTMVTNFVRNKTTTGSEPTISNPIPLYAKTKNQSDILIKYDGFDVSKNIVLKKFTTSQSSATIALANSQSTSNTDIDVDTLINNNNITINQNIPNDKSLFVQGDVNQAVTITPTISNITIDQKENSTFKKDRIEINSTSTTLTPNTKYTIEIDKSKFLYDNDPTMPAGNTKEKYTFTTEKRPQLTLNTKNIEKGSTNSTLTLTSSRPIEAVDTSNPLKDIIIVKDVNSTPIPIVSASLQNNNTLTIVLDVSSSALGNATINIPSDIFKRYLSQGLEAEVLNDTFTISRPSGDLKANLEFKYFSSSDELISANESNIPSVDLSSPSSSKTIDNLLIDSEIKIKLNLDVKAKLGKRLEDILKLSKGSVAERITDYYNITPADVTTNFNEFVLAPKKSLESDSEYTLTVDNSQLVDTTYNASIGDTKFVFLLKTEKQPVGTQGAQVNKDYSVTFDRKIDTPSVSDIKLYKLNEFGQYTEFTAISPSDIDLVGEKTLVIKNLPTGKYQIKLNSDTKTIKRKNVSTSVLYAKEFLGAVQDDTKPDFEIKSLASTVSDYIRLNKFEASGMQVVQVNKVGETNKNNTQIETDTPINVKFTIPYTYTNNAFSINLASDTTSPSLGIKSINKKISSSGAIDGVDIVLNDLLLPDTKYKLKIYKNKFTNSQGSLAGTNNETEEYEFTTEAPPVLLSADVPKIEKKATDQTITLKFDKNIELVDSSKITIDGSTAFTSVNAMDNTLTLSVGQALANSLEIKDHTVNIGENAIKRLGSKNLYVKAVTQKLSVVEDQIKKAEEDAKKKAEEDKKKTEQEKIETEKAERDAYRTSVANALAAEMQKRYQAEYGSDYDFKSFNDYIRDKYMKNKGGSYNGADYIQAYLKDYGYVDDFISKYGRNSADINAYAQDYLNRYGSFAYSSREKYDNPFFMNPFRDSSSKRGYYDYYDKYDYGYKFPEMRVGDDNISQANLEKEQKLKEKENELIAKERGYNINRATNYSPTGNNSPKVIITQGSRYFTEEDEYGNRRQVDMGVEATISNGRLFVAVTPLANKLGLWVNYNKSTKTTTLSKPNTTVAVSPNSSYITINGKSENMGIRPMIKNGKLMIPAHYLAKAFGLDSSKVSYEGKTIVINNY